MSAISFDDLIKRPPNDSYIYRGESEQYEYVSSGLLREYRAPWDVEQYQALELHYAKAFMPELDEHKRLTLIQHHGGKTNLIDFTTNYYVALFFACENKYDKDGRIILLDKSTEMSKYICEPDQDVDRAKKQASIFVRPPKGYLEPEHYETLIIPGALKRRLLDYLQCAHKISTVSIYRDVQGFNKHRESRRKAYVTFLKGNCYREDGQYCAAIKQYNKAISIDPDLSGAYNNRGLAYHSLCEYERAIEDFNITEQVMPDALLFFNRGCTYNAIGDYEKAVEDFSKSLARLINPKYQSRTYGGRGWAFLHLKEWEKGRIDLDRARHLGLNIKSFFSNHYNDVADFEERNKCEIPRDIVEMLS